MNTKNNQRAKSTQKNIEEVFLKLLKQHDIKKITVREISKQAHINPSTFYAHYQDVYDLMTKIEQRMSADVTKVFWDEAEQKYKLKFVDFFQFLAANQEFYKIYVDQMGKIIHIDQAIIQKTLEQYDEKTRNEVEYHFEFFTAGVHAVIRRWLNNGCQESPEELAAFIDRDYNFRKFSKQDITNKFSISL